MAEIARAQRQVNMLLRRRVPGELVDEIEDQIIALRTRLMNNDVALMVLVQRARRANGQRPERHQLDLDAAFRAMASVKGEIVTISGIWLGAGRRRQHNPPAA